MGLKSLAKLFNFVVCNPCQSSSSLTILVPLWFIIISLVFFYFCKALFSGKFVDGQNASKYRDSSQTSADDVIISQLQAISQFFSSYPPSGKFCTVSEFIYPDKNARRGERLIWSNLG